ncbi:uncharacterized protein LOC114350409 [Ostrinia furnacalis]|uniref:uncharacterized protein LOC114350409 n=1 Tax=Ostrinia furnacalis TaxID=93504 RepID=UPI001038BA49|nr:uncharacterized protein LOC114350409 [Ostrinia furnacalis]
MDINNPQSQSYWFVVREDQSNVYNFTIQNPPLANQEARYIVDAVDHRQYIQINEAPVVIPEETIQNCDKEVPKQEEENFWDRNKIKMLLTLCLENRFKNATKDRSLWNEIACLVGATPDECSKKYKNLRRTYIRLLKKKRMGKDIKWVHFNICEEVFKECKSLPSSILEPWEDGKVRRLLSLYIENLNRFRSSDCLQKEIWKDIATALNTTEYNCYHKFKNLKRNYFNCLGRSQESGKLMKWQYSQYFERIFYNYNPTVGPWDRAKTSQLIQAYSQAAHKFRNPRYQKKELWKEISTVVGVSPFQCDKKFRNLKQTFIRLKMKANSGKSTKWRYYKDFETIFNKSSYPSNNDNVVEKVVYKYQDDDYVDQLLKYYLENKDKFNDPLVKKRNVWKIIASRLGLAIEECDRKFRNLKQTYMRLREKKLATGKCNNWPYYHLFEMIYDEPKSLGTGYSHSEEMEQKFASEIKRELRNMQEKRDREKFETLVKAIEESNSIQRERNRILQALLDRK